VYFVGTHERQLDDKGRLALPSAFRSHLGEHCYLVLGKNQCIEVVPAGAFEAMVEQLMARVERGEISLQRQRTVAANATPVTIDKQGRIPVNEQMRTYAGLANSQPVVVTGNFTVVEIWQPARFQRVQELGTTDLAGDEL
jgi:transcriptional regulator MraZ